MYPIAPNLDKVNCLASLVGMRSACTPGTKAPAMFLEQIPGIDIQKLAKLARASSVKGTDYGTFLIESGAREMMADIELLMNNAFRLKDILSDICSACDFLGTYTTNSGIIIKNVHPSRYGTLNVTKLTIKANVTAIKTLSFDDGQTIVTQDVQLQAGVIMPVLLDYTTTEKQVKIGFTDPTVPLAVISCPTRSSCGCGGSPTSHNQIHITGQVAGVENAVQYGFIPCATISCSYDSLICGMIKNKPNIFGLALLMKIGEMYIVGKNQTERNNDVASYNDPGEMEIQRDYGKLYWYKMKGGNNTRAIKNVIHEYLKNNSRDNCVICDSRLSTAYATG